MSLSVGIGGRSGTDFGGMRGALYPISNRWLSYVLDLRYSNSPSISASEAVSVSWWIHIRGSAYPYLEN